jgi:signal transduction histidine kinase
VTDDERIRRLERRLLRERRAREEAERIGETVTRDLWDHQQELAAKVERRSREADQARRIAHDALEERADRLASGAHELLTPLHAVVGALGLLAEQPLDDGLRPLVDQALSGAMALREQIGQLLEDSDRGGPGYAPAELLDLHEADWQRSAARAGRLLIVDVGPGVPAWVPGSMADERGRIEARLNDAIAAGGGGSLELQLRADGVGGLRVSVTSTAD